MGGQRLERMRPYTDRVTECTSASVLCERPTDTRQPMDTTVLWYAMAVGLAILIAVGIAHWLRPKVRSGESNGADPQI